MNSFFEQGGSKTYDCYDFHINSPAPEQQIDLVNQFKSILISNNISLVGKSIIGMLVLNYFDKVKKIRPNIRPYL